MCVWISKLSELFAKMKYWLLPFSVQFLLLSCNLWLSITGRGETWVTRYEKYLTSVRIIVDQLVVGQGTQSRLREHKKT